MSEKWSKDVHETSRAQELPEGLFTRSGKDIAEGLKKVVLETPNPNQSPLQTAMEMLDFYINRAGDNLTPEDRERLDQAKVELRKILA